MKSRKGFTLVEIMIVVAIIGLLSAIAIPSFLKARNTARRNACINNLRNIDAAKDEYALEYGGLAADVLTEANVTIYIKDMGKCFCPTAVGLNRTFVLSYTIQDLTSNPTCIVAPTMTDGTIDHDLRYAYKATLAP